MTKYDLIDHVAEKAELTKKAAGVAVEAMLDAITQSLRKGDSVTLSQFGTFLVQERTERTGRNPITGAPITIPGKKVPKFRPSKTLKDSVNS